MISGAPLPPRQRRAFSRLGGTAVRHGILLTGAIVGLTMFTVAGQPAAASACLSSSTKIERVASGVLAPLSYRPKSAITYDMRDVALKGNTPNYPLGFRDAPDGVCITGVRITGQQPRSLTWREMKKTYDGDGIIFKYHIGRATVENVWIDNMMDALSFPAQTTSAFWTVRGVYARYVRDDFIENDTCRNGEIVDVLVDGAFMFLSAKPGSGSCPQQAKVTIRNSLVRLQGMPYDTNMQGSKPPSGATGHGQLFKTRAEVTVDVRDTIFRVDSVSVNAASSMDFAPGSYERVTLIWLGKGDYPGKLPAKGVTVTRDTSIWDNARAAWLKRQGCDASGNSCSFLTRAGTS
jgi:hypothetical protein